MIAQHESSHQQIEHLKLVIEKYRRMIFGSKSEKLKGQLEQLEFQLEELEIEQAASEAAQPRSSPTTTRSRPRAPRKPLPEDLPREVITHLPPHTCCPDCGGALRQFGRRCIRATGAHPSHLQGDSTCAAEVRLRSLRTGGGSNCAGAADFRSRLARPQSVGASCCVSKFRRSLASVSPSPRCTLREGIDLSRSTLAGWVGAASELLAPLVDQIREHVLWQGRKFTPMTHPFQCCQLPGTGKTKTARLWTYVRDDRPAGFQTPPAVWFCYSQDRIGRTSAPASEGLPRCAAGRCLLRISSSLWRRRHL